MIIHYYIERNKNLKAKEKAIWCYIRGLERNKTISLNTQERIDPTFWDKSKERAISRGKNKYTGAFELNNFLDAYSEKIKQHIRSIKTDNISIEFEELKVKLFERLGKVSSPTLSFFEAYDTFLETRKGDLSPDSIKKFKTLKKHLLNYEQHFGTKLSFSKMDLMFYDRFLSYVISDLEMVNNSAYKLIGLLKIFLNWTHDRDINKYQVFKKFKIKEDKVDIVTLNEEELNRIYKLDLSKNNRLERARDLFVFGCYTGGRFADLVKIEWSDIKEGVWYLRVQKTKDIVEIPLNDLAKSIIERYKNEPSPLPRISNQKLNVYIKEVCQLSEINSQVRIVQYKGSKEVSQEKQKYEFISAHTARRTFITQSLLRGMKAEIVMSISGHKNFKTFKKYLDITRKDKEAELKKAWNENLC